MSAVRWSDLSNRSDGRIWPDLLSGAVVKAWSNLLCSMLQLVKHQGGKAGPRAASFQGLQYCDQTAAKPTRTKACSFQVFSQVLRQVSHYERTAITASRRIIKESHSSLSIDWSRKHIRQECMGWKAGMVDSPRDKASACELNKKFEPLQNGTRGRRLVIGVRESERMVAVRRRIAVTKRTSNGKRGKRNQAVWLSTAAW